MKTISNYSLPFLMMVLGLLLMQSCKPTKPDYYNFKIAVNGAAPVDMSARAGGIIAIQTAQGDYILQIEEKDNAITYNLSKPVYSIDEDKEEVSIENQSLGTQSGKTAEKKTFNEDGQQIDITYESSGVMARDNAPGVGATGCTADGNDVCCWVATDANGNKIRCCGSCSGETPDCSWCALKFPPGWLAPNSVNGSGMEDTGHNFHDLIHDQKIKIKAKRSTNMVDIANIGSRKYGKVEMPVVDEAMLKEGSNTITTANGAQWEITKKDGALASVFHKGGKAPRRDLLAPGSGAMEFQCSGGTCACTGDADCNEMFGSGVCNCSLVCAGVCVGNRCICEMANP